MDYSIPAALQCLPDNYGCLRDSMDHLQHLPQVYESLASINQTFPDTNEDFAEVRKCSQSSSNNLQNSGQSLGITVKDLLYARPAVHDENQEAGEQSENFNCAYNISNLT